MIKSIQLILLMIISFALSAHGLVDDRLHDLQHHIEDQPDDHKLYIKLGRIYIDTENYALAKDSFIQAVNLAPKEFETSYWLGVVYFKQGKVSESLNEIGIALQKSPESSAGHKIMAEILSSKGDFLLSALHYDLSIKYDNNPPPQLFMDRFQALKNINPVPYERMVASLIQGIKQHGEIINFIQALVYIKLESKQFDEAKFWMNKLPKKLQNTPKWINKKADIERNRGNIELANLLYQRCLLLISRMPIYKQKHFSIQSAKLHAEQHISK